MGTAARIRNYRVRAGKSAREVARHVGINDAWYGDLEHDDEQLTSSLTLFQAIELASALGVRLHMLLGEDAPPADAGRSLTDLPALIDAHLARNGLSIEKFERTVGWALRDFIDSPLQAAAETPISFLQALTAALGIDWLALVPDDHGD